MFLSLLVIIWWHILFLILVIWRCCVPTFSISCFVECSTYILSLLFGQAFCRWCVLFGGEFIYLLFVIRQSYLSICVNLFCITVLAGCNFPACFDVDTCYVEYSCCWSYAYFLVVCLYACSLSFIMVLCYWSMLLDAMFLNLIQCNLLVSVIVNPSYLLPMFTHFCCWSILFRTYSVINPCYFLLHSFVCSVLFCHMLLIRFICWVPCYLHFCCR